jgi:hypothetical protein
MVEHNTQLSFLKIQLRTKLVLGLIDSQHPATITLLRATYVIDKHRETPMSQSQSCD